MSARGFLKAAIATAALATVLLAGIPATATAVTKAHRADALGRRAKAVSLQLRRLDREVVRAPHASITRLRVVQTSWQLIRLNRAVLRFNRLSVRWSAASSLRTKIVRLNRRVAALDARALRLNGRVRLAHTKDLTQSVTRLYGQLSAWAGYWRKHPKPPTPVAPTPQPSPTPTPTDSPTPAPTSTVTPSPMPTPTVTPTTSATPSPIPTNAVSVRDYGAKGDGVTDDTQAIRTAIAAGAAYVPAGTYRVSGLTLATSASLTGVGDASWINGDIRCGSGVTLTGLKVGVSGTSFRFVSGSIGCVFDHVTFTGGGGGSLTTSYVLYISGSVSRAEFVDCTIETNAAGVGDGVTLVDNGVPASNLHDITFTRCQFMPQPCMAFECLGRAYLGPRTLDYYNISLVDCRFEVQGSESVSFDCVAGQGTCRDLLVEGCHFEGSGTSTVYPWHQTLELNRIKNSRVAGNTFDRGDSWWLNCTADNCVFEDNVFDSTVNNIGKATNALAQAWGGTYTRCVFRNNRVKMDTGAGLFWFEASSDNQFVANTFTDIRNPNTQVGYFTSGSSRNAFDGNTFTLRTSPVLCFKGNSIGNVFRNTVWNVPGKHLFVEAGSGAVEE